MNYQHVFFELVSMFPPSMWFSPYIVSKKYDGEKITGQQIYRGPTQDRTALCSLYDGVCK
jgi:hypothetical protein